MALRFAAIGILLLGIAGNALAWTLPAPTLPVPGGHEWNVFWPSVAVDTTGKAHVIWLKFSQNASYGELWYQRGQINAEGTAIGWEGPQKIFPQQAMVVNFPRIVADGLGTLHISLAGEDGRIYYLYNTARGDAGAWQAELVAIPPARTFYGMDIALDAANTPYFAWGEGIGEGQARVVLTYRLGPNNWIPRGEVSHRYQLARGVRIGVQGAGDGATVHLLYEYQERQGSQFAVGYSRGQRGGGFGAINFSALFGHAIADNAALTVDVITGRIFAGYVQGSVASGYFTLMLTHSSNGTDWSAPAALNLGANIWPGMPWFHAANNTVHIVSDQKFWTGKGFGKYVVFHQSFDANTGSFSQPVQITSEGEKGYAGKIALGPNAKVVVYTTNNTQLIKYNVDPGGLPSIQPPPPPPPPVTGPPPTDGSFAEGAFQGVWERTDKPVKEGAPGLEQRTWIWGPGPSTGGHYEPYAESPGGGRLVQYFDKSRMEITNFGAPRDQWFVTNGLLVYEMISGQIQTGNASYQPYDGQDQTVAGDPLESNPGAPTYRSFRSVAFPTNAARAPERTGQPVTGVIRSDGTTSEDGALAGYGVVYSQYDGVLGHNIPQVFTDFFNKHGVIYEGGFRRGQIIDWLYVVGRPLSEPYWARFNVGGVGKNILVQVFERRVLTYTPDNAPEWRVEMGNAGQHYRRWRYGQ